MVRDAVRGGAEKKVFLAVDSRAKYGDAAAVVNEISKARIREICILANKREKLPITKDARSEPEQGVFSELCRRIAKK